MQEGETSNGMPAGKKRKKAEKSSCLVNGSAEENCSEKDHTREAKQKRRKRKHDGEIEKEQEKQDKDCIKEEKEKEKKRKRKNTDNVLNVGSCLGEKVTCKDDKVESKKKKKKKSLVDISNRDAISEDSNSDHNNDCKILTITNGSNKSEEQESSKSLVNDSSQSETSTVNWDTKLTITSGSNKGEEHDSHVDTRFSPEIEDQTPSRTNNRRVLHNAASSSSEPFAKFQKNSTPPAFVRKRLAKTPSTEPQQSKTSKLKVGDSFLFDMIDIINDSPQRLQSSWSASRIATCCQTQFSEHAEYLFGSCQAVRFVRFGRSLRIQDFQCWWHLEITILGAEQKDCCFLGQKCIIAGLSWPPSGAPYSYRKEKETCE